MIKRNRSYLIITTLITILPMLIGIALWNRLPDQVPIHFNDAGEADNWSGKVGAIFGIFSFIAACHLLCAFVTAADPRKKAISDKVYRLILWICPVCSLFAAVMIYGSALNYSINASLICHLFLGILFIAIGNYLPKCRQNYTIGIKLPWTLADADTWNATHRIAGPIWMAAGLLMILMTIAGAVHSLLLLAVILAATLIPCIYSFFYYQSRHKDEKSNTQP